MFNKIFYLIKYFFLRNFIRKYKISPIPNYGFVLNDYIINHNNELGILFNKYGSDKGGQIKSKYLGWFPHNYDQIYDNIFFNFKEKKFNLLEVGIGSVNQNIKSALPSNCKTGASLKAFRDYFPKAHIYGCDIDPDVLFKDKRITTFHLDQTSKINVKKFFFKLNKNFLIIIDDGLHEFYANIVFFEIAINFLKSGGIYVIEDVNEFKMKTYYKYFSKYNKDYRINFYNIYNSKFLGRSNNLIIINKK